MRPFRKRLAQETTATATAAASYSNNNTNRVTYPTAQNNAQSRSAYVVADNTAYNYDMNKICKRDIINHYGSQDVSKRTEN